jgi:hypothetical protein
VGALEDTCCMLYIGVFRVDIGYNYVYYCDTRGERLRIPFILLRRYSSCAANCCSAKNPKSPIEGMWYMVYGALFICVYVYRVRCLSTSIEYILHILYILYIAYTSIHIPIEKGEPISPPSTRSLTSATADSREIVHNSASSLAKLEKMFCTQRESSFCPLKPCQSG